MRKRKPRRARPLHAPFLIARNQATALTAIELASVMTPLHAAFDRLRRGRASQDNWCLLAGCIAMAHNIERQGVVRGLSGHLAEADAALVAIEARASATGAWRAPVLYGHEIEAIDTFVDLHHFQLRQLSYGEFKRALKTTEGQARSRGMEIVRLQGVTPSSTTAERLFAS